MDLTRKIFWLESCFSIIKKLNRHFSGIQNVIAGVCIIDTISYLSLSNIMIWTSTYGSARYKRNIQNRKIQSKRVLGLMKYTHWLADHNKVPNPIRFFVETCSHFENYFTPQPKNWHNRTTVLYITLSTYVTPKTISRQNKKLTQHHNCIVL